MDWFDLPPPTEKRFVASKQGKALASARISEFGSARYHAAGGKLFCRPCNIVRKNTIDCHIKFNVIILHSYVVFVFIECNWFLY